jgi:hypothetical protein
MGSSDADGTAAISAGLSFMTRTPTVVHPAVATITAMIATIGQ